MRMYITRHGQTDWNIDHRLQGRTDIPLNALGKAQAVTCGEALRGAGIELIITSPLSRAYETAEIVRGYIGDVPIICDELLIERSFGLLEGTCMYVSEAEGREAEFEVEPREKAYERIRSAVENYRERYPDKTILVVTHGGVLFELLCGVMGERLNMRPSELKNAGINCIEYEDEPVVMRFNLSKDEFLAENEMQVFEAYKENPCGVLSIPYWKNKHIKIPHNMRILHDDDFLSEKYQEYYDEPYFRLYHSLERIQTIALNDISIVSAKQKDIPIFVDVINQSYTDLSVTIEQLNGYTQTEAYLSNLWVMAVDKSTSTVVGCGIADFDKRLREGIIEWIQVVPAYRKRKIGQLIVNELLKRMADIADFVTVSGKVNNITSPEKLYRKCGFVGDDVWHILTKIE